jgi:hypothetical protein
MTARVREYRLRTSMVRRGSTVRVRQRALKSPQSGDFCCQNWYNGAPPWKGGRRRLKQGGGRRENPLNSGFGVRVRPAERRAGDWGRILGTNLRRVLPVQATGDGRPRGLARVGARARVWRHSEPRYLRSSGAAVEWARVGAFEEERGGCGGGFFEADHAALEILTAAASRAPNVRTGARVGGRCVGGRCRFRG